MGSGNRYYITALPMLGNLNDPLSFGPGQLLDHLADHANGAKIAGVIFLLDDLLSREAILGGEIADAEPVVLSKRQLHNEEPLPEYLVSETGEDGRAIEVDGLWENYFNYAAGIAGECKSLFLREWIEFEVSLRNALASERAVKLGLEPASYMVAENLGTSSEDLSGVIREWAACSTPLDGHKSLTLARWNWLNGHDAWFSFADDELAAYGARLMLLYQWHRLVEAGEDRNGGEAAGG